MSPGDNWRDATQTWLNYYWGLFRKHTKPHIGLYQKHHQNTAGQASWKSEKVQVSAVVATVGGAVPSNSHRRKTDHRSVNQNGVRGEDHRHYSDKQTMKEGYHVRTGLLGIV